MKLKLFIIIILFVSTFTNSLWAADGTSFDPSTAPFSARQLGLGGAGLVFANDANAVFSNPAGLAGTAFPQIVGSSRKVLLETTQYNQAAIAIPFDWGTLGFGFTGLNASGSYQTTLDPATGRIMVDASLEAISNSHSVMAFTYAKKFRPNLSLGGSWKIFSQALSGGLNSQASASGLDLSAIYQPLNWLTASANLQNILGGNLQWSGGSSDKIGGYYSVGCLVNLLGLSHEALVRHNQKVDVGLDINLPHNLLNSAVTYNLGVEYFPLSQIALRTGFNPTGLTMGLGIINNGFRFDYAYMSKSDQPGESPHYFSLAYIGDRVTSIYHDLKKKLAAFKLLTPKDRLITDKAEVKLTFQAKETYVLDKKTVWAVPALSQTLEVQETTREENLSLVYVNGIQIAPGETIEASSPLAFGRNVISLVGFSTPETIGDRLTAEVTSTSLEVHVLRFKPFPDTPMDFWAIEPIALSVTLGIVTGYPDESFKPEKGITRAELVTLLVRTMPQFVDNEVLPYSQFKDVPTKHWAVKYINFGSEKGLITGYPGELFKPNKVLTRAEGVTILTRYANLADSAILPAPFPDLPEKFWANKYIAAAHQAKMLDYLAGKEFKPSIHFTRAEACEILYRTPIIKEKVEQYWTTGLIGEAPPANFTPEKTTTGTSETIPITLPPTLESQPH